MGVLYFAFTARGCNGDDGFNAAEGGLGKDLHVMCDQTKFRRELLFYDVKYF